jgi:hypothetical protein
LQRAVDGGQQRAGSLAGEGRDGYLA